MTGGLITGAERDLAVAQWLALSAPADERGAVWQDWERNGAALLPLGVLIAGVRLPVEVVTAAAETEDGAKVDDYLARILDGPVICTQGGRMYVALVGPGVARRWDMPGIVAISAGTFLGVPRPGLTRADGGNGFWSVPMDSPAVLCMGHDVAYVAQTGMRGRPACGR